MKNNDDRDDNVSKNNDRDSQTVGLGDLQRKLKSKILNIKEIQKEKTNLANKKILQEMKNPRRAEKDKEDQKSMSEKEEEQNESILKQDTQNNVGFIDMEVAENHNSKIPSRTKRNKKIRKDPQVSTDIPEDIKDKLFKIQKRAKKRMDRANEKFLSLKKTKGLTEGVGLQHIQDNLKKEIEEIQEEAKKKTRSSKKRTSRIYETESKK